MARLSKKTVQHNGSDLISRDTGFNIVEAYKNLRTNLLFALSTSEDRTIVVTSSEPTAGKSTTAANLAITMALTGNRVLLIDGDMRRPVAHKMFGVDNTVGLSGLLSGSVLDIKSAIHFNVAPKVDLLTAGQIPPNPSELLGHVRMKKLLTHLSQSYDYLIVDMPPVNVVSDALLLTSYTAGAVVIARQRQTTIDELQVVIDKYHEINAPVLGVVITDVSASGSGYGYGGYGYGYGYYEYK
jgi:capsular exopolysaccharide synthesis family protein